MNNLLQQLYVYVGCGGSYYTHVVCLEFGFLVVLWCVVLCCVVLCCVVLCCAVSLCGVVSLAVAAAANDADAAANKKKYAKNFRGFSWNLKPGLHVALCRNVVVPAVYSFSSARFVCCCSVHGGNL